MTPTAARPLATLLLAGALLTACTGSGDDAEPDTVASTATPDAPMTAPPSSPPSASPSSTAATASATRPGTTSAAVTPPFPANTRVDTAAPTGAPQTVVAVRSARQQGFDRVVFELRGKDGAAGSPGWRVEYVARAVQDGSGDEVDVAGSQTLQVFLEGVALPFDTGQTEASTDLTPRDTRFVREVDLSGTFEGRFTAFVGLDRKLPFRVYRLSGPSRVVVDVRHG